MHTVGGSCFSSLFKQRFCLFRVVKIRSTKAKTLIDSQTIRIALAMQISGHLKIFFMIMIQSAALANPVSEQSEQS